MGKTSDWVVGCLGVAVATLVTVLALASPREAYASTPANITNTVGVCDPMFPQRCIAPAADGSLSVNVVASGGQSQVVGNVADGAADSGNPVKIGGVYKSGPPTLTNGQRGDIGIDAQENLKVSLWSGVVANSFTSGGGDAQINGLNSYMFTSRGALFNGTTWDRTRSVPGASTSDGTGVVATGEIPTSSASQGVVPVTSVGGSSVVAKAAPGNLFALNAVAPASAGFVQVFDLAAAPADASTNTPIWCLPLAASAGLDKVFSPPLIGSTGLTVVYSSSACGAALTKVSAIYLQAMAK